MHWICCLDYYIRITPMPRPFIFTSDSIIIYLQPSACNQNVPIFCTIYTNGFLFIFALLNQDYLNIWCRLSNGFSIFVILCILSYLLLHMLCYRFKLSTQECPDGKPGISGAPYSHFFQITVWSTLSPSLSLSAFPSTYLILHFGRVGQRTRRQE